MTDQEQIEGQNGDISPELDALTSSLLGDALDVLADTGILNVLLVVETNDGQNLAFEFSDDGPEQLAYAAHDKVRELKNASGDQRAVRYAIAYEGAIADESGAYQDALIVEFGERGRTSYSAYCYINNKGAGDDFAWTDPAPAGVVEALLG